MSGQVTGGRIREIIAGAKEKFAHDELVAFRRYGARRELDVAGQPTGAWIPNRPIESAVTTQTKSETRNLTYEMLEKSYNAAVVGEEHPKAVWKDGTFYFYQTWCHVCGRSPDRCVCAQAGLDSADTLTLPRFMKCPLCGTNPGRCEKALTSEETKCFSCGRELEEL